MFHTWLDSLALFKCFSINYLFSILYVLEFRRIDIHIFQFKYFITTRRNPRVRKEKSYNQLFYYIWHYDPFIGYSINMKDPDAF